jgi:hypothetical protein
MTTEAQTIPAEPSRETLLAAAHALQLPRSKYLRKRKPYSKFPRRSVELRLSGLASEDIAKRLQRNLRAVRSCLYRNGVRVPGGYGWISCTNLRRLGINEERAIKLGAVASPETAGYFCHVPTTA